MKIVKSYSLSTEAIKRITEVKAKHNYKSDSEALDAIILGKETDTEKLEKIVLEILRKNEMTITKQDHTEAVTLKPKDAVDDVLEEAIQDIFNQIK